MTAPAPIDVDGHRLTPLPEGPERRAALLALIEGAKASLRLLFYIYTDDDAGRAVRAALIAARGRGVAVSLIVDGFGSEADADFFRPLEEAGADVCRFSPRWGRRYLLRNHQKLALADGEGEGEGDAPRVIVGGFNVEDDYFGTGPESWRDFGLIVEGPAAGRLARYFDRLLGWSHTPHARIRDLRRILNDSSETEGRLRWLMGGPTRSLSPWAREIRGELERGRRADIAAAYFAPNPKMLRRIERLAGRGGNARVLTAAKSDNDTTIAAARHTYTRLLRRGVRVFEYGAAKFHTKLFVIDDVAHVGSANLDVRSLYLNLELMLRVEDAAFAEAIRGHVGREIAQADEVTPEEHARAGAMQRIAWGLAYFLVTVLDGNVTRRLNFGLDGR